jgi:hypothetical protein
LKCGERGYTNADGQPCGQPINAKAPGCIHHDPAQSERAQAVRYRGAAASRMRRFMPASAPPPEFSSTASIVTWAQETARQVLTGALDPRAAGEARQLAALTISARQADAQAQLVEALLSLEHGGAAVALLAQFTKAQVDGKPRPLPGRVLPMRPPEGDAS